MLLMYHKNAKMSILYTIIYKKHKLHRGGASERFFDATLYVVVYSLLVKQFYKIFDLIRQTGYSAG